MSSPESPLPSDAPLDSPADVSADNAATAEAEEAVEVFDGELDPPTGGASADTPHPRPVSVPPPRRIDGRTSLTASAPPARKGAGASVAPRSPTATNAPRPRGLSTGPQRPAVASTAASRVAAPPARREKPLSAPPPPVRDSVLAKPASAAPPLRPRPPGLSPAPGVSLPPQATGSVSPPASVATSGNPPNRLPPVPPAPGRRSARAGTASADLDPPSWPNGAAASGDGLGAEVVVAVEEEPPVAVGGALADSPKAPAFAPTGLARFARRRPGDTFEVPTQYDLVAAERHASPWTEERREAVLKENAQKLVELFEAQLARPGERQRKPRIHYEAARLYESPLGDLEAAARHYEQAAKLAKTHIPSVRGARRVLLSLKKHKAALRLFDAEMELTGDANQRALLLYEKAQLLAGPLGQRNEAREALRQALALAPTDVTIIKANALCEEQAAAWEEFVSASERGSSAEQAFPRERAVYLAQAARATNVHLKAPERAIELYKAAFDADPLAPGVLDSLKELLYGRKRWSELVVVLKREADQAESVESRAFAHYRAARVLVERLSDVDSGILQLEQAAALAPTDRIVLDELARLYEQTRRYDSVVRVLEHLAGLSDPGVEALHHLGQLYERQLNKPALAIERYQRALSADPGFRPALLALSRLREQRNEWSELVELLVKEADASVDTEQGAAIHARIADVCETRLASETRAVEHHKRALALRPGYQPSYKALVRLHTAAGRWFEVIEVYERGLELPIPKSEKVATLFSIGRLQEDAIARPGLAQKAYQRILEIDPSCLEAIHALQRAAERAQDYRTLVDALELEVPLSDQKPRNLALKHRAGAVLVTHLGETDAGIERFLEVLALDPTYAPAIESLLAIYYREGRYQELLKTYEKELVITRTPERRAALLSKMAELCVNELGVPEQAAVYYRRALQADEHHTVSVRGLRQVLTRTGDHAEVARLLGVEALQLASRDREHAARLQFLQGEIFENRLDAPEKALACYRESLTLSPGFRAAEDGCIRLLEQSKEYRQLDELLAKEIQVASEPRLALAHAFRRAEVQRDQLKQPHEAATTLEDIVTRHGGQIGTLFALERLYALGDEREALRRTLALQAQISEAPGGAVAAYRGMITLSARAEEVDLAQLKQLYQAILQLAPADLDALYGLERVALLSGERTLLSQIDGRLGAANLDRASTAGHQTRLAEAMEAGGDNSALEMYRAALANDPENLAAVRGVSRIAERLQSAPLLEEAAEMEATLLERPEDAARLLVLAASRLVAGGDVEGSVSLLNRALELYPDHTRAGDALASLIGRGVAPERVISVLSQAAASASSRERRAALWANIASLQQEHRQDTGAAIAACQRAIREQPSGVEAHALLAQLFAAAKKWKECVDVLTELLKLNPPTEVRFEAYLQLAAVQHDQLKASALAATNAASALSLQPDSRAGLALLLRIQLGRDELRKAAETAQRLVEVSVTREEKAEALFHSAKLERHRADEARAIAAYRGAVAILGARGEAAVEFRDYVTSLGAPGGWQAYADALAEYANTPGVAPEERAPVHAEVGRTLYDKLSDYEGGLSELAKALALRPTHSKLRAEFAERSERAGRFERAVREYQQLITEAPQTRTYWRSISNCLAGLGHNEQASMALAPLIVAREATAEEQRRYQQATRAPGELTTNPLSPEELRRFEEGSPVAGVVVELLSALSVVLPKIFPIPFETYGVNVRDKITARSPNTVRDLADRIANAFGVAEFDLYVHTLGRPLVSVEYADVPALFVHADVAMRPKAEQVLLLARALFNVARGTQLIDMLSPTDLEVLLASAVRNYEPNFATTLASTETLDAQARRVSKAMPWFKGNRVEPAARSYAAATVPVQRWVVSAHLSAVRGAAMAADDLAVSLGLLSNSGFDDRFVERVTSFMIADSTQSLRRRLFG